MIGKLERDWSIKLLSQALDGAEARHKVLAMNINNVNTPKYKGSDVPFQQVLRQAMTSTPKPELTTTDSKHLAGRPQNINFTPVKDTHNTTYRVDGNNVDIEVETAKLAENSLLYTTFSDLLGRRISLLRSVINEGRR